MTDYRALSLNIGLPLQFAIKEHKMFDVFSKLLAGGWKLPLVGGTAVNKIYLAGEERFSEDLDFEMYGKKRVEKPELHGYAVRGPFVYRRNIRFEAEYTEADKRDRIRIDINIKPGVQIGMVQKTAMFLTGNTITGINSFALEGLIARKILALSRRTEGKDFYDIWHSIPKIDDRLLIKEIEWLSKVEKARSFVSDAKAKIESAQPGELSRFNNYIPVDRRPDWRLVRNDVLMMIDKISQ